MTLPNTPLKEWLPSSSSLQNVEQRGGVCCLLLYSPLSSRNRLPKSPPSSDPKNGKEWLQEARALSLQNALQPLQKPFSGLHAAWYAASIRVVKVQKFTPAATVPCYSAGYSTACSHLCARMVAPGLEIAVFGANFALHCVVELPRLLRCL